MYERVSSDANNLAGAHERLAELYEVKGNKEKASLHASRFVELWKNADPELQPRVLAKQQLLLRLRAAR